MTTRLTGWTAIEVAERVGLRLCKAADPTEGARAGLTVGDARAVAAEDPALVYLDLPVTAAGIELGNGKVWFDHPRLGWIEMPVQYDASPIGEEDLVHDSQLRRLSDREARDISESA